MAFSESLDAGLDSAQSGVELTPRVVYLEALKRLLDLPLGAGGLLVTLPLWLVIAVAIRLDSSGPVFYVHDRIGQRGRVFRCFKFRSMLGTADQRLCELSQQNEMDGPVFKMRHDPRVTRVGRVLRRTSLDELPQLLNVIRGDMSVVGPRPPLPREVRDYSPQDLVRLDIKPGLTCLWQVSGRSDIGFEKWMELDREYIAGQSFFLDLRIMVRTIWAVLSGRGAY